MHVSGKVARWQNERNAFVKACVNNKGFCHCFAVRFDIHFARGEIGQKKKASHIQLVGTVFRLALFAEVLSH